MRHPVTWLLVVFYSWLFMKSFNFHREINLEHDHTVSCLGCSGVTEDGETFMGTNGLRSSCVARDTHVLQVRRCVFVSWM